MRKAILILLLALSITSTAQTIPQVYINIDSGAYVGTTTGFSANPFSYTSHGSYGVIIQDPANYQYTYVINAGFPAQTVIIPKVSLIAVRYANPPVWYPSFVTFQLTIHHAGTAKWYGNSPPIQGNGQFFASPTNGNAQGPTHFSGEFNAMLICSTDSTDIIHIHGHVIEAQKL